MMNPRIYIGYDSTEVQAYEVCRKSILRRASIPVEIIPLRQDWLRGLGLYWREPDPRDSTEFTFTRFLVPYLMGYEGSALFVDCDFVFLADIAELFALFNDHYAVQVVQHDHRPTEVTKMGGKIQTPYPKKNWASLIVWHCGHWGHAVLRPQRISELLSREVLKEFGWLSEREIGALPEAWNVLSGYTHCEQPKAIHFTTGIRAIHGAQPEHDEAHQRLWEEEAAA